MREYCKVGKTPNYMTVSLKSKSVRSYERVRKMPSPTWNCTVPYSWLVLFLGRIKNHCHFIFRVFGSASQGLHVILSSGLCFRRLYPCIIPIWNDQICGYHRGADLHRAQENQKNGHSPVSEYRRTSVTSVPKQMYHHSHS